MAWNDPDWGKKNSGGPPDLDELWRRFNQKLNGMFGRSPVPGEGGGKAKMFGGFGLIAALVLVIWIGSGFYIVNPAERGVVLRFGKYVETTMPGPRWHIPYPVESVEIVNVQSVRTVTIGYRDNVKNKILRESQMLTDDQNIVDVEFAVQYVVTDPKAYLFNNRSPDDAVFQAAETAIREIVGKSKMDFVLGGGDVAARAQKAMQVILDSYGTGISIHKVTMQDAQPPEQVQAAFDDAVKAGQDMERQINEGQAYANDVIPRAHGAASRLLEEANGYKQSVIAKAEGDASRFRQIVTEYNKAPAVTRERLYLNAMQEIYGSTTKVLVDQKGSNNLLYLPLDKLIQSTAANAGGSAPSVKPAAPAVESSQPSQDVERSRDALSGRDREDRP